MGRTKEVESPGGRYMTPSATDATLTISPGGCISLPSPGFLSELQFCISFLCDKLTAMHYLCCLAQWPWPPLQIWAFCRVACFLSTCQGFHVPFRAWIALSATKGWRCWLSVSHLGFTRRKQLLNSCTL